MAGKLEANTPETADGKQATVAAVGVGSPDYAAYLRVARHLRRSGHRTIGLVPVGRGVATEALGVRLSSVLADLADHPVGVVIRADTEAHAAPWLFGVELLHAPPALGLAELAAYVRRWRHHYRHLLVPLQGIELKSQLAVVLEALDGAAMVVRRGGATEDEVLQWYGMIPDRQRMGVVWLDRR